MQPEALESGGSDALRRAVVAVLLAGWGGVVTLSPGSDVSFNEIVADDEVYGAGIYVEQGTQLAMDGVKVEGNAGRARTYLGGAAVTVRGASLALRATTLANNRLEALPGLVGTGGAQILGGVVSVRGGILLVRRRVYPLQR